MADKEKKKKPKKKEEAPAAEAKAEPDAAPAPAAAPAPEPEPATKSPSESNRASRGSKRTKRSGSNVFSMFSQKQVAEFKEGFSMMDHDKDGIISKSDLRHTYDQVGRLCNEKELDEMIGEASGPINFTQLLNLFATRMSGSGGADDDDVVMQAFKSFDDGNGKIDAQRLKKALMTFGDKFTQKEINDAYDLMDIDDNGKIDTESLINMLLGTGEEEES
ncbi:myosin regulatory light chain 2-like [Leptopilina boulardi]|uniref:myosin regulatory light chain 2-like n=1 Tax=Leptopilina boulardi TaxID=63433 RepID=UPI0021F64C17|nr:myosin regulatory light chain 2-like [Leptopilina boulardi]